MDDLIRRQDAIDIERNLTVDTTPSHFEAHQNFMRFMDDAEISSFGRWQWSNGFNTALTAVGIDLKKFPSAQPEITDGQAIAHLQESGWMQAHDKQMYEMRLREQLADDSDSYLPSAQPERKKGRWIDKPIYKQTMDGKTWDGYTYCSECREMHEYGYRSNFCPNCGAEMRGEANERE